MLFFAFLLKLLFVFHLGRVVSVFNDQHPFQRNEKGFLAYAVVFNKLRGWQNVWPV